MTIDRKPLHRHAWALLSLVLFGVSLSWQQRAGALDPKSTDPRAILQAALDRQSGTRTMARMKMQIRDRSGTRERTLITRSKRYDDARKTLILIEQPADVRNTGFLSIDYRAGNRADEQWLYLPKLHRVARVPGSGKSDAFVGSDFSIADLSQDPENFNAKILEPEVKLGDEICWLIEVKPKNEAAAAESGYEKVQFWVSKQKGLTLQLKGWSVGGKTTKYFKAGEIRQVNGIWVPYRLQMRTLEGSSVISETTIETLSIDNDAADVVDGDFTQQRLERGV